MEPLINPEEITSILKKEIDGLLDLGKKEEQVSKS